jgi:hypothetical protein
LVQVESMLVVHVDELVAVQADAQLTVLVAAWLVAQADS